MSTLASSILSCTLGAALLHALSASAGAQTIEELKEEFKLRQDVANERIKALEDKFSATDTFRVYWKDGLRLTSPDNKFDLKIGGRIHFESEWNDSDQNVEASKRYTANSGDTTKTAAIGPLEDGMELRRARLYLSGLLYDHVEFKWQYDFAKGAVGHKDVYVGLVNLGDWIPNLRMGHQYEQFGLDALTSSNDSTFIERAAISNIIAPNRNPGFMLWKNLKVENEERLTWALGAYREDAGDNSVSANDGAYNFTGRITGTPFWQDKGKRMVHVGLAATRRSVPGRNGETVAYAGKPEVDLFGNFVNTGLIGEASEDRRYGAELAGVWNRWSLQGEYMVTHTELNRSKLDDPSFHGFYVQGTYSLFGENRRWKPAEAIFQNPKPFANAFENGGMGAWELALRYSTIDLTDGSKLHGGVQGGALTSLTAGINWYLNPNTRVMFDVSRIDLDELDRALGRGGQVTVAQMRVQLAF